MRALEGTRMPQDHVRRMVCQKWSQEWKCICLSYSTEESPADSSAWVGSPHFTCKQEWEPRLSVLQPVFSPTSSDSPGIVWLLDLYILCSTLTFLKLVNGSLKVEWMNQRGSSCWSVQNRLDKVLTEITQSTLSTAMYTTYSDSTLVTFHIRQTSRSNFSVTTTILGRQT